MPQIQESGDTQNLGMMNNQEIPPQVYPPPIQMHVQGVVGENVGRNDGYVILVQGTRMLIE